MNSVDLRKVLELHKLWLEGKKEGKRASLIGSDLTGANLQYANLEDANLTGANLSYANLSYANLQGANLRGANLKCANLNSTNLINVNLSQANMNNVRGIEVYSIDNIGTFNGKITYLPSLDKVWAGCWSDSADEFYIKCDQVIAENGKDLNLGIAKNFVRSLQNKYTKENSDEVTNEERYKCILNGTLYGSGSLKYMNELLSDYVVSCKTYGKDSCTFEIVKDESVM